MDSGPARGSQGQSVRVGRVGQTKPRFQTSPMQTARDALRKRGGHHYRGNPPQLRYTPIADAASRCRGNPSLLRNMPTAYAACHCRGNPLQQRDSAAGRGGEQQNSGARASLTTAGQSLGRQTVASLHPSWAGPQRTSNNKAQTPQHRAFEKKKGFFNELCCSRNKHSSITDLNEQQSAQLSN